MLEESKKGQMNELLTDGSATRTDVKTEFTEMVRSSLADVYDKSETVNTFYGLTLVTCRELRDEELYLNYRLNPRNPYPSWYSPVDVQEDTRRWER